MVKKQEKKKVNIKNKEKIEMNWLELANFSLDFRIFDSGLVDNLVEKDNLTGVMNSWRLIARGLIDIFASLT